MKFKFKPQEGFYGQVFLNLFFILITFGIYLPWGVTNIRRLVWSNTSLKDQRFYYLGQAKEILKGYLVLIGLYLVSRMFGLMSERFVSNIAMSLALSIPASMIFVTLLYKAQLSSFRYQAHRTVWKGIRFKTDLPGVLAQYLMCLKWAFFTVITFGLLYLYFYFRIEQIKYNSLHYGQEKFSYSLTFRQYASVYLKHSLTFLALILVGGVGSYFLNGKFTGAYQVYMALTIGGSLLITVLAGVIFLHMLYSLFHVKIKHLKTDSLSFSSDLTFGEFLKGNLINIPILVLTFGVGFPIVVARNIGLYANSVSVNGIETMETINVAGSEGSQLDDVFSHNFDLDILDVF